MFNEVLSPSYLYVQHELLIHVRLNKETAPTFIGEQTISSSPIGEGYRFHSLECTPSYGIVVEPCSFDRALAADFLIHILFKHSRLCFRITL
jgi:hypothetical protein